MAITRWAPFSAFTSLEREMQDMMDRLSFRPWSGDFAWRPTTDVFRKDGNLVIRAEVPGIDPDEGLDVELEGNVLHIRGEKKVEKEIEKEHLFLHERHFGSFSRDVLLPDGIDPGEIAATLENGVLTITVPVPEEGIAEAKTTTIEVTTV